MLIRFACYKDADQNLVKYKLFTENINSFMFVQC